MLEWVFNILEPYFDHMFDSLFFSFISGLYLLLGGAGFSAVGKEATLITDRFAGELPGDKPLILDRGFFWTFPIEGDALKAVQNVMEGCKDQRTDMVNRVCFKVESVRYWIPRESQASKAVDCPSEECELPLGLKPNFTSKFKLGKIGGTEVRFYMVAKRIKFPFNEDNGLGQHCFLVKRKKKVAIKPIYLTVQGKLSFYFSASSKSNHTQKKEYKIAISNQQGVMAGFFYFR
ncbi:hypothetical protein DSO57_1026270 [Entomophthora muscae]|uniref:Uncharacterized protein n=1 Tax=Entomophthora muscae TaxID=34485 RepID=A0ACC2RSZ8_9FUNG|nr:hypothetical protein DSO57_1026270 [Entomophthora muscae]